MLPLNGTALAVLVYHIVDSALVLALVYVDIQHIVWFDFDVMRLNYDGRGKYLGEFAGSDRVLVVLPSGEFYTTGFEATNHYEDKVLLLSFPKSTSNDRFLSLSLGLRVTFTTSASPFGLGHQPL